LRLVGSHVDVYKELEPHLKVNCMLVCIIVFYQYCSNVFLRVSSLYMKDFRKLRYRGIDSLRIVHVDEFIEELLTKDYACDIAIPHLQRREVLKLFHGHILGIVSD